MRRKISSPNPQQKKLQKTEEKIQETEMKEEVINKLTEEKRKQGMTSQFKK
ncbi:MAG: hypothetical protein JW769_02825 [Parachlamydiales bacterium]|nr:hypothetical protein [Parachlamydiales bacterium]